LGRLSIVAKPSGRVTAAHRLRSQTSQAEMRVDDLAKRIAG